MIKTRDFDQKQPAEFKEVDMPPPTFTLRDQQAPKSPDMKVDDNYNDWPVSNSYRHELSVADRVGQTGKQKPLKKLSRVLVKSQ